MAQQNTQNKLNSVEVPLLFLKTKVGKKLDFYAKLSKLYQLPAFNSKAITSDYLKSYIFSPCLIFRMQRENFNPPYVLIKHVNATDILEKIEILLRTKNKPPTGIDPLKLPDTKWLIGVYFFLSPTDKFGLFPKTIKPEADVKIEIDPE